MDYAKKFKDALDAVHREGRYRVFADVKRRRGAYPAAEHFNNAADEVHDLAGPERQNRWARAGSCPLPSRGNSGA